MEVKRTEQGWIGHFICAEGCRFRRNTLLERGEKRVVVSTMGDYHSEKRSGPETIGHNRYYETMAFKAKFEAPYWEANVMKRVSFKSPWCLDHCKRESDLAANAMHEAVVAELTKRMMKGG